MRDDIEAEERGIYLIAIFVLAPVAILAAFRHVVFGAGSSICLLAVVLSAIGLVKTLTPS